MNPMQQIRIEKLTLNFGAGKDQQRLEKGILLLKHITGIEPKKTVTNKRIQAWGLRPGLPIGCKVTLRKIASEELLKRLIQAKAGKLLPQNFDTRGNVAFGVPEYIDIPGVPYDPKLGVMGFQVCATLERPGYHIQRRKMQKRGVGKIHTIKKEEAIKYFTEKFGAKIGEE